MVSSPRTLTWGLLLLLLGATVGLVSQALTQRGMPHRVRGASEAVALKRLSPLQAEQLEALGPEGDPVGFIIAPVGATDSRPLHLVLPWREAPEAECRKWGQVVGAGWFVLCPKLPVDTGARDQPLNSPPYPSVSALEARLKAALGAAKARFGKYLDKGPISLSGEGMAAGRAVVLSRAEPAFFSRLLLVGAGYEDWSPVQIQVFSERGGLRVVFLCERENIPCQQGALHPVVMTRRFGVSARVSLGDPGLSGSQSPLGESFRWLWEDDLRFSVLKKP